MRIIAIRTLKEFWEIPGRGDAEQPLRAWYAETMAADWEDPNDVKSRFPSASIVGNDRLVFNIKGNKYCLIVAVKFEFRSVYIRFVGTHKDYDKVDARSI